MPEAVSNLGQSAPGGSRSLKIGIALGFAGVAVAFAFYLRLFARVEGRTDVFAFFFDVLFPSAMIHTALFLLITLGLRIRARGMLIFWSLSAVVLLSFGGWARAGAFVLILLFGLVLTRIGKGFARHLLPESSCRWGICLALGAIFLTAVGAFLAWVHLFTWWMLALIILISLAADIRTGMSNLRLDFGDGWDSFISGWNIPVALAYQALFLLGVFAFVGALAPEMNSDAVRFYWPYMRLLRHYSGFFDGQRQWCYIIPQAGLIYGSAVLSLLGSHAVRLSMLLAWVALIGTVCRRWADQSCAVRYAIAVVVASCPVMLWVATSLMQDLFVCVAVVALAVLCVEGAKPDSVKLWAAIGICAGTAWAAKYSTLAYTVPLVAYAAMRSFRAAGVVKTLRSLVISGFCFLTALSPWLVHSYQQSGNPVFPFLIKIFPSPLWPRGALFGNLDNFRLPPGLRGWLLWPLDLTYHTSRFVEGYDGRLGITLLVLLILSIPVLWKGNAIARSLTIIGIISAAFLCSQTAYVRYWLPSLWLVAIAASHPMKWPLQAAPIRVAIASAAFLIMFPQALSSMLGYWPDPQGWPWKVYAGKMSPQALVGSQFEALSAEIERRQVLGAGWPKVWFTGYEAIGHFQVQPMEATIWEQYLHTVGPREQIQYLSTAGCEYWIVNEEDEDALWFRGEGISHYFWNESNLVAQSGALAIYRMPVLEQVLREFDARALPGNELLLNGSFEIGKEAMPKFWLTDGAAPRLVSVPQALDGQRCVQLKLKAGLRQVVALPPGVKNVELMVSARSAEGGQPVSFRYQMYTLGFEKDPASIAPENQVQPDRPLTGKSESATVAGEWQQYRAGLAIPDLARYIVVRFDKPEGSGEVWIDSIHLYSR
ncbi:MAG: hypothetical protein ABSH28_09725 [Acidobacteriota bacterium]